MPTISQAPPLDEEAAFNLSLGRKLAARRQATGARQVDLASAMGCSCDFVDAVESGNYPIGLNLLQSFANALGVTAISLLRSR